MLYKYGDYCLIVPLSPFLKSIPSYSSFLSVFYPEFHEIKGVTYCSWNARLGLDLQLDKVTPEKAEKAELTKELSFFQSLYSPHFLHRVKLSLLLLLLNISNPDLKAILKNKLAKCLE